MAVTSDLRFNHSDLTITITILLAFDERIGRYIYLVCAIHNYGDKFCIFMLSKHSLDINGIGDEGGVALGDALKVNKTLQTLR